MKVIKYVLASLIVLATLASCNNGRVTKKSLETEIDSASYALGLNAGIQLKQNFDEMDVNLFFQGFENGVDSTAFLMESKDVKVFLNKFFRNLQAKKQEQQRAEALKKVEVEFADVKVASINFLDENKTKEGVKTTDSGLQYIVLKEGVGNSPVAADKVKVHYHGTLIDGTVFDSSVDKGEPATFGVSRVIKGWTEGLQLMNVGAKYRFFIPQELAYGAFPRKGGKIRPFDALIFDVEMLEIIEAKPKSKN
ncbi:FKBP-type peptidyl-prolyl cis-trans isomerase [Lutibacter sp. TH_r2]|uniref:FKBP-type peptidyl-prolyl cis-trans isomerase n=1 Tax=Lutibacter sp. TH_r2 TaxID=3082083 RepID=UPI0029537323|nr:FKBP-type peptidyl-prolyl cis-trans isomerase [Lutibacter sp. TH_r2]MDV7188171.1 FKBP-type peptidyl-prolyl cis-trans isomerase [Lutibacter sp. TH_r2]